MSLSSVAMLVCFLADGETWTPPEKPVPWKILREAERDADEGRHELALVKHLWYHEHAEKFDGVGRSYRLSMALRKWHQLGKKYPAALESLKDCRSKALERVKPNAGAAVAFREYAEINRELEQHDLTARTFRSIHEEDAKLAGEIFRPAAPALLATREYELYGKYVDPKRERNDMVHFHENQLRLAEADSPETKDKRILVAMDILRHRASTLVACLVKAGRDQDAATHVAALRKVSESKVFQDSLDEALKGVPAKLGEFKRD